MNPGNLAAKLAPEGTSFPTLAAASFYGQPASGFTELKPVYEGPISQC